MGREDPLEKEMATHSIALAWKSHGRRSLVGYSPWGHKESDTTERLPLLFSLSCTGEGNGNPLQCSCLENPRDGGAWWASVYGVTQSRTRLKRLSSSSMYINNKQCIAQGTLLNVMWQPGWEGSLGENGYMYMCGQVPLLFT